MTAPSCALTAVYPTTMILFEMRASAAPEVDYAHVAARIACNYFNTNPVHCLRSDVSGDWVPRARRGGNPAAGVPSADMRVRATGDMAVRRRPRRRSMIVLEGLAEGWAPLASGNSSRGSRGAAPAVSRSSVPPLKHASIHYKLSFKYTANYLRHPSMHCELPKTPLCPRCKVGDRPS